MLLIKISHILAISGLYYWQSLPLMIKYSAFYPWLKLFFLHPATPKSFGNNKLVSFECEVQNMWADSPYLNIFFY